MPAEILCHPYSSGMVTEVDDRIESLCSSLFFGESEHFWKCFVYLMKESESCISLSFYFCGHLFKAFSPVHHLLLIFIQYGNSYRWLHESSSSFKFLFLFIRHPHRFKWHSKDSLPCDFYSFWSVHRVFHAMSRLPCIIEEDILLFFW